MIGIEGLVSAIGAIVIGLAGVWLNRRSDRRENQRLLDERAQREKDEAARQERERLSLEGVADQSIAAHLDRLDRRVRDLEAKLIAAYEARDEEAKRRRDEEAKVDELQHQVRVLQAERSEDRARIDRLEGQVRSLGAVPYNGGSRPEPQ